MASALAASLLVGGGIGAAVMAASSDPTQTEEYRALEEQTRGDVEDVEGRLQRAEVRVDSAEASASEAVAAAESQQRELDQREQAVKAREDAVTATEDRIAANSIENGMWTVGVDIEPGTYRTSEALTGYCYWAILKSGTNGSDIVENDGPTGGFPTVQLRAGQDFENNGCGTFVKQ